MKTKLISVTQLNSQVASELPLELQNPEGIMAYTARVSSGWQDNPDYAKLLAYCIKNQHWSVFEMVDMTVEIETSRAIAQQILRHRSFSFQEFSQRYAQATSFESYEARRQDNKNRQNSVDDMSLEDKSWFYATQDDMNAIAMEKYEEALSKGIAKEQARFLLPLSTTTKLYMKGSVRSWIHYLSLRSGNGTQKEHKDIAVAIKELFKQQFPIVSQALEW